jgi:hypothetical protein
LQDALRAAKAGAVIEIASGTYPGGFSAAGLSGEEGKPVTIQGVPDDAGMLPLFSGGSSAFHLSSCTHLVLRDFRVAGCTGNGINLDDSGDVRKPAQHILLANIVIDDIGPAGNHDALKLSGVTNFTVRDCTFRGWGGSGIDMVGCSDGTIDACRFEGKEGFSQGNAVQIKGGSRDIRVTQCFFLNPGHRAINIGGHTGLPYFRPEPGDFEATRVEVAGNRFVGGMAAIAWATAQGGRVHHNTFYSQEKWVLRILQENPDPRFKPCANGVFEDNVVVYDDRVQVAVNVGAGTNPSSFSFNGNAWHNSGGDGPARPQLPVEDAEGVYDLDPDLAHAGEADMRIASDDARLRGKGADGFQPGRDGAGSD